MWLKLTVESRHTPNHAPPQEMLQHLRLTLACTCMHMPAHACLMCLMVAQKDSVRKAQLAYKHAFVSVVYVCAQQHAMFRETLRVRNTEREQKHGHGHNMDLKIRSERSDKIGT
jgi:hypothetical protein